MQTDTSNVHGFAGSQAYNQLFNDYLKLNFRQLSCAIKQYSQEGKLSTTGDFRKVFETLQQAEHYQDTFSMKSESPTENFQLKNSKKSLNPSDKTLPNCSFKKHPYDSMAENSNLKWFNETDENKTYASEYLEKDSTTALNKHVKCDSTVKENVHLAAEHSLNRFDIQQNTENVIKRPELKERQKAIKKESNLSETKADDCSIDKCGSEVLMEGLLVSEKQEGNVESVAADVSIDKYRKEVLKEVLSVSEKREENISKEKRIEESELEWKEPVDQSVHPVDQSVHPDNNNFLTSTTCIFGSSYFNILDYDACKECESCKKENHLESGFKFCIHKRSNMSVMTACEDSNFSTMERSTNMEYYDDGNDVAQSFRFFEDHHNQLTTDNPSEPFFKKHNYDYGLSNEIENDCMALLFYFIDEYASVQQTADLESSKDISIDERDLESKIFLPREVLESIME